MIVLNLKNVLTSKGITEHKPWLVRHGIAEDTAKKLLLPKRKSIAFRHLEIICYELKILPNEVFIWQPDTKTKDIADHPLQEIRSGAEMPNLVYEAGKLSIKGLKKAEAFMKQLQDEELAEREKKIEERKKKKE